MQKPINIAISQCNVRLIDMKENTKFALDILSYTRTFFHEAMYNIWHQIHTFPNAIYTIALKLCQNNVHPHIEASRSTKCLKLERNLCKLLSRGKDFP